MGSISDYLELELIDHIFETGEYVVPTIYIALSTADPGESGATIAEPSGNNYERKVYSTWNTAASRAITNNGVITFNQASGAWGTVSHYAIFDHATAGNMLAYGALTVSKGIVEDNTPSIADTDIEVSFLTGGFSDYLAHKLLDHIFGNGTYAQPSIHVALSTSIPTDAGNVTEPSGNNYARKAHTAWDVAADGHTENTGDIEFNTPSGSWGLCVYSVLYDALTAGNYLARGDIIDQSPAYGDTVKFSDGDFDVTLN